MTVRVCALGASVPAEIRTNEDLARTLDTSDEWIQARTGIRQRHLAGPEVATSDLAVSAGRAALAQHADVDAVLLATTTPDHSCPPTAPAVANRLGLTGTIAFDVNAACSGFIAGLATGAGLIEAGIARRVLVIGADMISRIVDFADRNTAVLFGDGAGAVVLEPCAANEPGSLTGFDLGADGGLAEILYVPAGGTRQPVTAEALATGAHKLRMAGKEVYRHAVVGMDASARRTLDQAGLKAGDVDHFVGHQANARILEAVADRLGVPEERRVVNVDRYGNTSAASIPLALADLSQLAVAPGANVLLTAFGAGLSWGSVLLRWPDIPAVAPVAATAADSLIPSDIPQSERSAS